MSPRLGALMCMLGVSALGLAPVRARAQVLGPAPEPLQFEVDPIARSPRLVGMGGLVYTVEDQHNQIALWDLARNPIGLIADRDSSNLEVWGNYLNSSLIGDQTFGRVRQSLAAKGWDAITEAWRRSHSTLVYGAEMRYLNSNVDRPEADQTAIRGTSGSFTFRPTIAGAVKWVKSNNMRWALRVNLIAQNQHQQRHFFIERPGGDYLGGSGELISGFPNLFDANSGFLTGTGLGGALDYRLGPWVDAAIQGDYVTETVSTDNTTDRSVSQYEQKRPFATGSMALIGRVGSKVEWGVDGRIFRSTADESYNISISGGIGNPPLAGRGARLTSDQNGSILNGRLLFKLPQGLRLGFGGRSYYEKLIVNPPPVNDQDSYNLFLNHIYSAVPEADSLALADSISRTTRMVHAYEVGGGLSWSHARRLTAGIEYHVSQDKRDAQVVDYATPGPYVKSWDVRAGGEYRCTERLVGRVGFDYTQSDLNTLVPFNDTVARAFSLGVGYYPTGASWAMESGYRLEWPRTDYGDPTQTRGNRQSLGLNVRWLF
jgi:hypothetical protein